MLHVRSRGRERERERQVCVAWKIVFSFFFAKTFYLFTSFFYINLDHVELRG